jgi:hypothetical protein
MENDQLADLSVHPFMQLKKKEEENRKKEDKDKDNELEKANEEREE